MQRHAALAVLLLALVPGGLCGGFLNKLTKDVSHTVGNIKDKVETLPVDKMTPEKMAQALETKKEVVGSIKDAVNQTVSEIVSSAEQTVAAPPNVTQVLDATSGARKEIASTLQAAGDSLKQSAGAVADASSTGVQKTAQDIAPADLAKALKKANTSGIAEALAGAAPEVAAALNKTGMDIAQTLKDESPKVAGAVNRTAKMFGAKPSLQPLGSENDDENGVDLDQAQGTSGATWMMAAAIVVPLLGGIAIFQKYRGQGRPSGMLLSDGSAGSEMVSGGPLRLRAEPAAREPFFTQMA